jgi:hypothetical protein
MIRAVVGVMFISGAAAAASYPSLEEKIRVRSAVQEVAAISRRSGTLDELGRQSMRQSAAVLKEGPGAVYTLSGCLVSSDWKVRYWIVDIMGYLDNANAERPLLRVLNDTHENESVRQCARRSLMRIKKEK